MRLGNLEKDASSQLREIPLSNTSALVDANGDLLITFSPGHTINAGHVVGESGLTVTVNDIENIDGNIPISTGDIPESDDKLFVSDAEKDIWNGWDNYEYWKVSREAPLYGKLYNFHAASNIKGLALGDWRVPTDTDWDTLTTNLGGSTVAGGKLKETGTTHWTPPNTDATNESGFTALPGGYRDYNDGTFRNDGYYSYWWSSTANGASYALYRGLNYTVYVDGYCFKQFGFSVRCVRDVLIGEPDISYYYDIEGFQYQCIKIGNQVWMAENLNTKYYADGSLIPNITDGSTWAALTTGAWCYYNNNASYGSETVEDQIYSKELLKLGINHIHGLSETIDSKQSSLGFTPENIANRNAVAGYVGKTLGSIDFNNVANDVKSFITNTNASARTYTFQDRNGMIADNTDLVLKVDKVAGYSLVSNTQISNTANTSGTNTGDNANNTTSNAYADAKVQDSISDGIADIAPSQNAVFDALLLKEYLSNKITSATFGSGSTNTQYPSAKLLYDQLALKVDKVSSTDNAIVRFNGAQGIIQNSTATLSDAGEISTTVGVGKVAIIGISEGTGVSGEATGADSFGVDGKSDNIPGIFCNTKTVVTGINETVVSRGNSANLVGDVQVGYGLRHTFRLPINDDPSNETEKDSGSIDCVRTNVSVGLEESELIWSVDKAGTLTPSKKLLSDGSTDIIRGSYCYHSQAFGLDTAGDWRIYSDSAGFYTEYCTVGNAVKGSGTWVNKHTISI